ncbi:pyroglutamyl-peptidase I [Deinococcus hopiensis]|uniref:Pyroglutamyl-peptidase I n=1 Tax=Deinococcus hopiensis KR-140 TaxID=695939 RepID=A0A1W1VQ93_9DEIO|nr:pyroglutamyl-peptidase I [Deinococcus hopiensis]SMB95084.1 pyroglutamyl-peptidase I Cysteine peptidase. MEROPS family C15 [Deinococcus hopiensis KR-140]
MSTLLLTGFEPFHTHPVNPSAEAAKALNGAQVGRLRVSSALLPVEPHAAAHALRSHLDQLQPDAVLLTGLAAGRPHVTLERVAVNVMDFAIPDNAGQTYRDAPASTDAHAPAAYFSTLPLRPMLAAWREAELPGSISNSAGLYVCNHVMYQALHALARADRGGVPCGFLHLPASAVVALAVPEDRPPLPYLPQAEITRAVQVAAETVAATLRV